MAFAYAVFAQFLSLEVAALLEKKAWFAFATCGTINTIDSCHRSP
jgi:hypothetical protein